MCVVIDKRPLRVRHPKLDVLTVAWSRLTRWCCEILQIGSSGAGDIKPDRSAARTGNRAEIAGGVMGAMTRHAPPELISKPVSVHSASAAGMRVADAIAYRTLQHEKPPGKRGRTRPKKDGGRPQGAASIPGGRPYAYLPMRRLRFWNVRMALSRSIFLNSGQNMSIKTSSL